MPNAVLVTDMLRGFLEAGHPLYVGEAGRKTIPNIEELLDYECAKGSKIFFLCDRHTPDDPEFKIFPPHCLEGSPEAELIPELARFEGEIIPKRRYSGFFGTPLDKRLQGIKPETITVCGVLTNICVMHTVADARNRDYDVEVPLECVASSDERQHQFALGHMKDVLGARLVLLRDKVAGL